MKCIEARGRSPVQIAFIDPSLEAWEVLATGVKKGIEVIVLDPVRDAFEQITAALQERKGVEAVHIICHGSPGALHLGQTTINARDLDRYAALIQSWQAVQSTHSDPPNPPWEAWEGGLGELPPLLRELRGIQPNEPPLLRELRGVQPNEPPFPRGVGGIQKLQNLNLILYACQVAAGEIGRAFLEKLQQLTGANIAASSSPVGNPQLGGNWELDAIFGKKPAAETAFSATAMAAYPAVLSPSFGPQTTYGAGSRPHSIAVGDFSGDNIPDLAVANAGNSVSVLLGDGSGSFSPQTTYGAANGPRIVAAADFNGDGSPDLVNTNDLGVSVLLADGSGSFSPQTTYGAGGGTASVAVGDFNRDGSPDLAAANYLSDNVSVLLGDGSGSFGTQTTFGAGDKPVSLAVEDFNGDGNPDLAVANYGSDNVSVLLGDGSGSFGTQTTFGAGSPWFIAAEDFNGDNRPDLAVADRSDDDVSVLLGDGSGSFGTQTTFGAGSPWYLAVGDFNRDGSADLAVANQRSANVSVLLGDGSGSFGTGSTFDAGNQPAFVAVEDFNGDGKPDLVVTNFTDDNVSVLLNTTPIVSIAPGTPAAEAGPNNGSFDITLDEPAPAGGLKVNFNVTGSTASDPADYSLTAGTGITGVTATTFTIAAGATSATLNLVPIDDSEIETGGETVNIQLETGSSYIVSTTNNTAALTITDDDFSEIEVAENGVSIVDAGSFDFGSAVQGSSNIVKTFTITNSGTVELTLGAETLTGNGYSLVGAFPTANIVAGDSTTFQIQLDASSTGTFNGNLSFVNGDSDENPYDFSLTGQITAAPEPEIAVSDGATNIADGSTTALDFGSNILGASVTKTFTIANIGSGDLSLSNLSLPSGFNVVGSLPTTIAPQTSASLEIQLDTSAPGNFNGTISFDNNDADENPFDFAISGTVTTPAEIEVSEGTTNIADGTTTALDFGSTLAGTAISKTFTIQNTGGAELSLNNLSLPSGFSVVGSSLPASIAPGSSASLQIQLDASSGGSFNGEISFESNDADENPFNFAISGTVTTAPEIEVRDGGNNIVDGSTTALDFGNTAIGTAKVKTFTIANIGSADLNLSNLSLPTGFSQVGSLPATIAPGGSESLEIQLDASAIGSFNGAISFENNDADEGPFDFAIGGTVTSNPPFVANSVFSQVSGFNSGNQFSFAADSYVDPDPGDSVTYSIALSNTWSYSWYDWATGTNGSWYRKPKEGIVFPEVPLPSWLSFDPATRTLSIDEATRPTSFFYGVKVTGTDLSGASVTELFPIVSSTLGGFIIDNYIAGATVFWDGNKNGIQDAGEPSTTSDQTGGFNLDVAIENYDDNNNGALDPEEGQIVAVGGIDTATGLPLETPVKAAPESTVVTLLTTLVADLINNGQTVNEANEQVVAALSLSPGIDVNSLDPIAATENNEVGGTETLAAMVKVQNVITQTANLLDGASTADFNAIVQNVVGAITSQIQTGATLDVSNSATLETIINSAALATQQNDPNIDLTQVQAITSGAAQVMAASNQQIDTLVASGASGATLTAETANIQKVTLGDVPEELEAAAEGTKDIALVVAQNTGAALLAKVNTPGLIFASPVSIDTPAIASLPTLSANIELVRNDATAGTDSDDTYIGDSSDNSYLAYSGNDVLFGNSGNDWMNGNRGDDSLDGGEGNDTLYGGKDNDTISGNNGADVIFGNRGSDSLRGNNGDDFVNGNQGEDILFGGNGNDILYGGKENDTLNGGDGTDTLSGDLGNDILTGGNGSDSFVLKAGYGSDILTDFEDGQDFLALADGLTVGQLAISQENGSTLIRFEEELLATLQNVDASLISSADFVAFG
ncbi:MAG: choice-of-anchor D domain-containing protein [Oscillatoria sp. SIO1A7]|nr:choice-of-anchor D domain-containing protein [Oscillatoria sp. SIO1A7]